MNKKIYIPIFMIYFIISASYLQRSVSLAPDWLQAQDKSYAANEIGGIKIVRIPAGSFMMGSPEGVGESDEHPQHKVTLDSFSIGIYEVTQKQYRDIMGKNPGYFKGDNLPVEQVTWDDANEFCKRFSGKYNVKMRLPTEAEWEYACRAGTTTQYYWGNEINGDYCWYGKNSEDKTHAVGEKKPNAWGLYDMSGNVWEWCTDWYNERYYMISQEKNPQGPNIGSYRILRGGGRSREFGHRAPGRSSDSPDGASDTNGFRVVVVP